MARIKHIQHVLTDQWSVLATLTPSEYVLIRPYLATSSGFQSAQYREVEFLLGNKNPDMVGVFRHDPKAQQALTTRLTEPALTDQWWVLAPLTPSEYVLIRPYLATSSGFQSAQYREVEFLLGNKNPDMVGVFRHDPKAQQALTTLLREPSLYDEFLRFLARSGNPVPQHVLDRDVTQRSEEHTSELQSREN